MLDLNGVVLLAGQGGDWSSWPFGPGFTAGWLMSITKFVFIGLVLGLIMLVLRLLFGPKGPFRDKELEREAEEEKRKVQEAVDILNKRLAKGEISEEEFMRKKRMLRS
ncbi:MAG: SHOCT domain-containing protein [Thermodesulfobacteriota bacterium]